MGAADAGASCSSCRSSATWPATSRQLGLRAQLVFDRETGSRLGITPAIIDQTLYDSYGQRQISTMFTQLNQYHVILEVEPQFQRSSARPARPLHPLRRRDRRRHRRRTPASSSGGLAVGTSGRSPGGDTADDVVRRPRPPRRRVDVAFGGGPAASSSGFPERQPGRRSARSSASNRRRRRSPINHQGQFPVVTLSFNLAPGRVARRGGRRRQQGEGRPADAGQHPGAVSGRGRGVRELAGATSRC